MLSSPNPAYRQIDAAGQNDQGHAHRHDTDKGKLRVMLIMFWNPELWDKDG
jgi:hypothetical protein